MTKTQAWVQIVCLISKRADRASSMGSVVCSKRVPSRPEIMAIRLACSIP